VGKEVRGEIPTVRTEIVYKAGRMEDVAQSAEIRYIISEFTADSFPNVETTNKQVSAFTMLYLREKSKHKYVRVTQHS